MDTIRTFEGAVALITGGASGIGRAIAENLAARGAFIAIADRQATLADEVASSIRASGRKASAQELDVRDFDATRRWVEQAKSEHGRIDYFFNNAGIGIGGEVRHYKIEDWYQVLDVNVRGVVHGVQAVYPLMVEQRFGHIVNTASMAGLFPTPLVVSYGLSKHAVVGLSTSLRIEAARYGVRVSALCPGVIRTPILQNGGVYGKQLESSSNLPVEKMTERLGPMPVDRFAENALRAIEKNRSIIIEPARWRLLWWLTRLSPALGAMLARSQYNAANPEAGPSN